MTDIKDKLALSCFYGERDGNSISTSVLDKVGDKLINYRISKIRTQYDAEKKRFYGMQFFYKNLEEGTETPIINIVSNKSKLVEQEMDLNHEEIVDVKIWLSSDVCLLGFEIITNKNKFKKFGGGNDDELITVDDLQQKDKVVLTFSANKSKDTDIITGIDFHYINKDEYVFLLYEGVLSLRNRIKKPEFQMKVEKEILPKASDTNKVLYKICALPDNQFSNIIKYSI